MRRRTRRNLKDLDRSQRRIALEAMRRNSEWEILGRIIELDKEREAMEVALGYILESEDKHEVTPKFIMVEDWSLDELRNRIMLDERGYNRMKEYGIKSFREILELGWDGLLEIPGVGWATRSKCANRIKEKTGIIIRGYPYD
ncbi:hypothetical protein IJI94_02235 [Candidatus Saccharibacteria bacterium]|nr:hypothetical protein [Candidatus Saccharibacteria bacterium]